MTTAHVLARELRSGGYRVISEDGNRDFGHVKSFADVDQAVREALKDLSITVIVTEQPLEGCPHLVRTSSADGKTKQCDICEAIGDVINPDWEPRWRPIER